MPFDGSGNYTPAGAPNFPAIGGNTISSTYYNNVINDIAVAISNCITRDGQGKPSGPINWNAQNITNLNSISGVAAAFSGNITAANIGTAAAAALDTDGTLAANSDTKIPSQKAIVTYIANKVTGVMNFKGAINCTTNPNFPAATIGDSYVISGAGHIGGAAGALVEPGDMLVCTTTSAAGDWATVNNNWDILQKNLVGALITNNALSELTPQAAAARANIGAAAAVPQVQAITSATTITPTFANDMVTVSALAAAATIANATGTAVEGWGIVLRIRDNGTARALTWGTAYRGLGAALPTTTVINKWLYVGMVWNNTDSLWDILTVVQQ